MQQKLTQDFKPTTLQKKFFLRILMEMLLASDDASENPASQ